VSRSRLWRAFESGATLPLRALRFAILLSGTLFLGWTATLFLGWKSQGVLAGLTLCAALVANRVSKSYVVTLSLVLLSVYSSVRYGLWRFATVTAYSNEPGAKWTGLGAFFIWVLLAAECYAFAVLVLGYIQTLWPLRRSPVPLPGDPEEWPAVDVLIPTCNEPLSVVRFTALAAMNIDWPAEKLNVYILDDGKREEFRAFATEAGIGYMSRDSNADAKAGNINAALGKLNSPLVAIFDWDDVPTRSFLQLTVGWFLRDQKLGVLQTPQHHYSPNPFERNLDQFHVVPNEDELFYGVVQDGNDFWNSTLFCGSCAVLRRSALDEIGGIAMGTVAEDTHTSLRMQRRGWNTAYINIPQAAGLASERLSEYVRQRIRWARGTVQILRLENPLFARGLKVAQRLCYFSAMVRFLYALPRLIFLTAPTIYLIFGIQNLPGFWLAIVAYWLPHHMLAKITRSQIEGQYRHSFWNEIYETVLAPYILLPTIAALILPRGTRFRGMANGGVVEKSYFDARIARPFFMLCVINILGLVCAMPRIFQAPSFAVSERMAMVNWPASLYAPTHAGIVWVYVMWTLFNLTILGVALAVACESQQRRKTVRVVLAVPSDVILADGSMIQGITSDLSSGGVRTMTEHGVKAAAGDSIRFVFPVLDGSATLPATVIGVDGGELRARFDSLNLQEDEALTMILYSRADAWLGLGESYETDRPVRSLGRILRLSIHGLTHSFGRSRRKASGERPLAGSTVPMILLGVLASMLALSAHAASQGKNVGGAPDFGAAVVEANAVGQFDTTSTLGDVGVDQSILLRGVDASHSVRFYVPRNELVKTATLKLRYHFSPGLLADVSHLNVSLNGTLIETVAVNAPPDPSGRSGPIEAAIDLPPELVGHENQLTFEFIGHYAAQCEDASNSTLWARVDASSTIELVGSLLAPGNDLSSLPAPFYEQGARQSPVPMVFLAPPSAKAVQAAAVIASWLGVRNESHAVRFAVSVGTIPAGNAIVITDDRSKIPASLGLSQRAGATVSMVSNPVDPYASLLVIAGGDGNELLTAARALTLRGDTWKGSEVSVDSFTLPDRRAPDDAPRWLSTEGHRMQPVDLQGDGSVPVSIYLRLPPDLSFGARQNLGFHLSYRYNGIPLGADSTLQVYVNGAFVSSTPLPHTDHASNVLDTVIAIPVADLRPFSNTITFQFAFRRAANGNCTAEPPANLEGTILKDSYLDIAGISHSTVLPNLELFANAGYPFTRSADLAETAVVLPDRPSSAEVEMFLALMGHFGAETGYPALRVTVIDAVGMESAGRRDYLVLGTAGDQPALTMLGGALPVETSGGSLQINGTQSVFDSAWWGRRAGLTAGGSGELRTQGGSPEAMIEGLEWPALSQRSVVAILFRDDAAIPVFVTSFLARSQAGDIAQSVSVLDGERFSSSRIGGDAYRVGRISLAARLSSIFEDDPWLIAGGAVLFCFLMAVLIQAMLRRHARERLQGEDS
jgi:cellulose synthase (UDP-forming)